MDFTTADALLAEWKRLEEQRYTLQKSLHEVDSSIVEIRAKLGMLVDYSTSVGHVLLSERQGEVLRAIESLGGLNVMRARILGVVRNRSKTEAAHAQAISEVLQALAAKGLVICPIQRGPWSITSLGRTCLAGGQTPGPEEKT